MKLFMVLLFVVIGSENVWAKTKIIDGDSLFIDDREIRLSGIDAPEFLQVCYDKNGKEYECGQKAKDMLEALAGKDIKCQVLEVDRYKREVAICFSKGKNINEEMVKSGWAVAYTAYTKDYVKEEAEAKLAKKGIWQGRFMKPELYRALKR